MFMVNYFQFSKNKKSWWCRQFKPKVPLEWTGNVYFEITFVVGGP